MVSRADDPVPARRADWRDTLRDAADLAFVGILVIVASLPVVTAGAAVATASAAIHDRYTDGRWPELATTARRYARAILPGVPVTLIALVAAVLLGLDLWVTRTGAVPGGAVVFVVTLLVAIALAGVAGIAVVEVGRTGASGWLPAARRAWAMASSHPLRALAVGGVIGVAVLLSAMVPITAPILAGYVILALHAVARRRSSR